MTSSLGVRGSGARSENVREARTLCTGYIRRTGGSLKHTNSQAKSGEFPKGAAKHES